MSNTTSKLNKKDEFNISTLFAFSVVMMFLVEIAFGHSTTWYTILMLGSVVVSAIIFINNTSRMPSYCIFVCGYCFVVPFLISLTGDDIQDVPMAMVSLILPFVFSSKPINTENAEKTCWVVAIAMIVVNSMKRFIPVLNNMNVNGYTFMIYMGLTSAMILLHYKKNFWTILLNLYAVVITMNAGSRNGFVMATVIFFVSLLPYPLLSRPLVFRVLYGVSLGYQLVSLNFLIYAEENPWLKNFFDNRIQPLFNKNWGIESRVDLYKGVSEGIWQQDIFTLLFGNGHAMNHGHNGFYQMVFIFGLVGTILILVMCIYFFEMALKVIRKEHNHLVMGCSLAMCALFLMQGADVFLFGVKSCKFVPFLILGIILSEYYKLRDEEKRLKQQEQEEEKMLILKKNEHKNPADEDNKT